MPHSASTPSWLMFEMRAWDLIGAAGHLITREPTSIEGKGSPFDHGEQDTMAIPASIKEDGSSPMQRRL